MASNAKRITSLDELRDFMKGVTEWGMDYGTPEDKKVASLIAAERGFKQEDSFHVGRDYPTIELTQDGKGLTMVLRKYYEPVGLLSEEAQAIPVNISTGVRTWMQKEGKKTYRMVMTFARKWAKGSKYPYLIAARKNKLFFSAIPFDSHPWVQHFKTYTELYRNEALAVALGARGIILPGGEIDTPAQVDLKVPDGVIMLLKKSTGTKMGYYPGMWQVRLTFPFLKGLVIIWHDDNVKEFFNTDTMKLKRKVDGKTIREPIPARIVSSKMVAIANSDDLYSMRMSHQVGYLLKNTIKSKGGAWGVIPSLISNALVKENKDKGEHTQVDGYQIERVSIEELMPDFIRTLQSMGLPRQYMGTVQQIHAIAAEKADDGMKLRTGGKDLVDTVLLAARPVMGKMAMFAALPQSYVGMKVGWYSPPIGRNGPAQLSDHIGRVPFMAHGGGIQKIKWAGESPLLNTIMAVVEDITPDEQEREDAAKAEGKTYTRKDSPESAMIWKQISAMGADSDGDRLIVLTAQGLKMLKTAGLYIELNPEGFKAKNQYPGLNAWTEDMIAAFWEASTPRLGEVGKGDTITRDALDAYKSLMFDWKTYYRFALHGAGQVQVGVSAPKYYFNNPYFNLSPMAHKELRDAMEEDGIGSGRKFFGLLWDEAREKAESILSEFLPETMEIVTLRQGVHTINWKGGYSVFHDTLRGYSPEQGVDWPTVVRNAFFKQLMEHGIVAADVRKGLKGEKAELAHKLIRQYIRAYPHRINVWAWFLDERMTGVEKDTVLKTIGLPHEEKDS